MLLVVLMSSLGNLRPTTLIVVPVVAIGWAFGQRFGCVAGVLGGAVTVLLGRSVLVDPMMALPIYILLNGSAGWIAGWLRQYANRLKPVAELLDERDFIITTLDTIEALVVVLDVAGKIVRMNRAFARAVQTSNALSIGRSVWELAITPELADELRGYVRRLADGEDPLRVEQDWSFRGQRLVTAWTCTSLHDERGAVTWIICTGTDITRQRLMEEANQASQHYYRQLARHLPDTAVLLYDQDLRYVLVEGTVLEGHGFSREQIENRTLFEVLPEAEARLLEPLYRAALNGQRQQIELAYANRFFLIEVLPMLGPKGKVVNGMLVSRDITQRKLLEQALTAANGMLANRVKTLEDYTRDLTLINEFAETLHTCTTVAEAYAVTGLLARAVFPGTAGALYIHEPERPYAEPVVTWGSNPPPLQDQSDTGHTLALRLPLQAGVDQLGVLTLTGDSLLSRAENDPQLELLNNRRLAVTVADMVALAVANLRLRERLSRQSLRDPLTDLFNRRAMEETLAIELHRARRDGSTVSVVMVDIDHFKRFNDTYGHTTGDELLRRIASLILNNIREGDIACRYGGEEFLVILPSASAITAVQRAELLRDSVAQLIFPDDRPILGQVTLSLGVATFPQHGTQWDELVQSADAALYDAKRHGRNQVMLAPIGLS